MAAPGYRINTTATVALAAATAKSVLGLVAAANKSFTLTAVEFSFDGVTASTVPVLVELCRSDGTTAGSGSAETPVRVRGPAATATHTAVRDYSTPPTVLTP